MAEIKRVSLQSVDVAPGPSSKKTEKVKEKEIAPSIRFVLDLEESNEQKYPEFNYAELLKSAEKKEKQKKEKKKEGNGPNGLSLLNDTDDNEKVLDVARYFESKYGNRKKSDYVDLGAGYDESDSFIDNTDAYDELVPAEVTTVHGGFYVNSGPLEFKDSDQAKAARPSTSNDNDNAMDEEEESSDEDSDEPSVSKSVNKRTISSSDDEEVEEVTEPPKSKPRIDNREYTIAD